MRGLVNISVALLLLMVFVGSVQAQQPTPVDSVPEKVNKSDLKKYIDEGNRLYEQGKKTNDESMFNEAAINYQKALQADKKSIEGKFNLADALYKQQQYEKAASMFQDIAGQAESKDLKSKAYHNLGNSLMKSQKYKESMEAYKQALKVNPDDMDTKYNYAYAKQMMQQQQQQQQQNQDKKDDKKDEKQEKQEQQQQDQKQDDKKDQNKDQQQQQQNQDKKDDKEQQQQQPKPDNKMSKEEAERMLKAVERDEKDIQEKLRKVPGAKVKVEKDW